MSGTVVPRTFPYRPSGGFTPGEIWGGPAGPGLDEIPSGATSETKDRLKQIGISTLDTLLAALQHRILPEAAGTVGRAPGEVVTPAYGAYDLFPQRSGDGNMGPSTPIHIEGVAPQISSVGKWVLAGLGVFLVVALLRERSRA